jgi:RAQPRD family integrative conjugative element protein
VSETTGTSTRPPRILDGVELAALLVSLSAHPAGTDSETTQLVTIERQLDSIDRLATASEQLPDNRSRYHFGYVRLYTDVARMCNPAIPLSRWATTACPPQCPP